MLWHEKIQILGNGMMKAKNSHISLAIYLAPPQESIAQTNHCTWKVQRLVPQILE